MIRWNVLASAAQEVLYSLGGVGQAESPPTQHSQSILETSRDSLSIVPLSNPFVLDFDHRLRAYGLNTDYHLETIENYREAVEHSEAVYREGFEAILRDLRADVKKHELYVTALRYQISHLYNLEMQKCTEGILSIVRERHEAAEAEWQDMDEDEPSSSEGTDFTYTPRSIPSSKPSATISTETRNLLEHVFSTVDTLSNPEKKYLAKELGLTPKQVENWFANRRQRRKTSSTPSPYPYVRRVPGRRANLRSVSNSSTSSTSSSTSDSSIISHASMSSIASDASLASIPLSSFELSPPRPSENKRNDAQASLGLFSPNMSNPLSRSLSTSETSQIPPDNRTTSIPPQTMSKATYTLPPLPQPAKFFEYPTPALHSDQSFPSSHAPTPFPVDIPEDLTSFLNSTSTSNDDMAWLDELKDLGVQVDDTTLMAVIPDDVLYGLPKFQTSMDLEDVNMD